MVLAMRGNAVKVIQLANCPMALMPANNKSEALFLGLLIYVELSFKKETVFTKKFCLLSSEKIFKLSGYIRR